jgi:anti-anti-sigma regulatory factor
MEVEGILGSDAELELKGGLRKLLDTGGQVVKLDMSKVETITSVCIGAIVALWIDLCAAGRRMELTSSPSVKKVLDMTGLTDVLGGAGGGD